MRPLRRSDSVGRIFLAVRLSGTTRSECGRLRPQQLPPLLRRPIFTVIQTDNRVPWMKACRPAGVSPKSMNANSERLSPSSTSIALVSLGERPRRRAIFPRRSSWLPSIRMLTTLVLGITEIRVNLVTQRVACVKCLGVATADVSRRLVPGRSRLCLPHYRSVRQPFR